MIHRLALLLSIAGCLLFGAIILIELKPVDGDDQTVREVSARSPTAAAANRRQTPKVEESVATILARPLFSSTRRPPPNASQGGAGDSDLADTRLTGIVTAPGRRFAIFAVSGDKPLRVAEGEAVSGWRIESITPREVSLSGPSGTKTLQPKIDPNLASPQGQSPIANAAGRRPNQPIPSAAPGRSAPSPVPAAGPPRPGVPVNNPGLPPRPTRQRQQQR
jgi:general secretion pathway protein N